MCLQPKKFIRMDRNHRYKTSRDYHELYRLLQITPVICIVDNDAFRDGEPCRDIACTKWQPGIGSTGVAEISCRGIGYIHAWEETQFVNHCQKYNVEFLIPTEI
jgi:hypothetical protein